MREICAQCQLPLKSCLCSWVHPITPRCDWAVWQDPNEAKHAKNTLRLLSLCWPDLAIWSTKTLDQAAEFDAWLFKGPVYVVFPAHKACLPGQPEPQSYQLSDLPLALQANDHSGQITPRLLFIDATWRKASAMLLTNPQIARLPRLHLDIPEQANYLIRKSPSPYSLSSFEAIVACLERSSIITLDDVILLRQGYQGWQKQVMGYRYEVGKEG
jgi:DTW domain-containing protein YfiP